MTALTNHAGGHSQGMGHANDNAAFMSVSTDPGDDTGDGNTEPAVCSADTPDACDSDSCASAGGLYEFFGPGTGCAFP